LGLPAAWYTSALGAHLSWSLPFGLLIMFAILGRLNPSYEEAAYDLGATRWQSVKDVVIPIVFPGMIAVALFGFTLSYDEFPRSWLTVGTKNKLPPRSGTMTADGGRNREYASPRDLDHDDECPVASTLRAGHCDDGPLFRRYRDRARLDR